MPTLSPSVLPPAHLVALPIGGVGGVSLIGVPMGEAVQMAATVGGAFARGDHREAFLKLDDWLQVRQVPAVFRSLIARDLLTGYAIGHPFSEQEFYEAAQAIDSFLPELSQPELPRPHSRAVLIVLEPDIRGDQKNEDPQIYFKIIGDTTAALGGTVLNQRGQDVVVRVADHEDNLQTASEIVRAVQKALGERGVEVRHELRVAPANLDPGLHPQIRHVVGFAQRGALLQALEAKNHLKTVEACDTLLQILRSPVEFPKWDGWHDVLIERTVIHRRYLLERPKDVESRRTQFVDRLLEYCEELIHRPLSRNDNITPNPIRLIGELKILAGQYNEEEIRERFVESFPALSALLHTATRWYCLDNDLELHALQVALAVKGHPALNEYDLIRLVGLRFTIESERERLRRWREAVLGGGEEGEQR